MFRSYSDHLQGARMFLVKDTDFKIFKNVKVNVVMRQHNIWCVYVQHPANRTHNPQLHTRPTLENHSTKYHRE